MGFAGHPRAPFEGLGNEAWGLLDKQLSDGFRRANPQLRYAQQPPDKGHKGALRIVKFQFLSLRPDKKQLVPKFHKLLITLKPVHIRSALSLFPWV